MNQLLAVIVRELRERWLLFPTALVLGFAPFVLTSFGLERRDVPLASLAFGFMLAASAAVLTGSTMLARDAANGRLGFLFSRPLSWPTIWGAKWLAAVVLVSASGLLAVAPMMMAVPLASLGGHHGDSWLRALTQGPDWTLLLCQFVLLVGVANFCATAFRSRSGLFALDLALLAGGFWLTRRYVAPLWLYGVLGSDARTIVLVLLPVALGLFAGSAAQTVFGRTDPRRAHSALSLVFWATMAVTVAGAAGYWHWVRSAGPADVKARALTGEPAGRWIYLEGSAVRGGRYPYGYFIDTTGVRYVSRPAPSVITPAGARFSQDGRFGALLAGWDQRGTALDLYDLASAQPRATHVRLESGPPPSWATTFALSPSASSAFLVHDSGASIFTLPAGRRLATATIAPGWRPIAVRFLAEGQARAWLVPWTESSGTRVARAEMRILDLAADGRSSTTTFPLESGRELPRLWQLVLPDVTGRRIVTLDAGAHLRDGATGALLATLSGEEPDTTSTFLADGRLVVGSAGPGAGSATGSRVVLRVFDSEGKQLAEHAVDTRSMGLSVGPEVAPGKVLVSSFKLPGLAEDTLVVDVADGQVVERLAGLRPAQGFWWTPAGPSAAIASGHVAFLQDAEGRVIRFSFASGGRTVVAGAGAPRGERVAVRW